MTISKALMRPAWRATNARAIASCQRRHQSASAVAGRSMMEEHETESRRRFLEQLQRDESLCEQTVYSLSFAGGNCLESDFESDDSFPLIDERMKRQLQKSYNALLTPSNVNAQKIRSQLPPQLGIDRLEALYLEKSIERTLPPLEENDEAITVKHHEQPLPKTISDILSSKLDEDSRAIVVTDTTNPFRIVAVNTAWEELCGYKREECRGRAIGRLLQGPETDMSPVSAMLAKLLLGEQSGAVLTNYTKQGRKFQNNIRVGPIYDEMGKTVHYVGILREVNDDEANMGGLENDGRRMQLPFMS
mmetsp:Transcript_2553/g.5566  ORF Transcript_2553/g.5566 Transcript_2553/m.5566 type:complete len:304 (-) Transcript_2553:952-1863(-)